MLEKLFKDQIKKNVYKKKIINFIFANYAKEIYGKSLNIMKIFYQTGDLTREDVLNYVVLKIYDHMTKYDPEINPNLHAYIRKKIRYILLDYFRICKKQLLTKSSFVSLKEEIIPNEYYFKSEQGIEKQMQAINIKMLEKKLTKIEKQFLLDYYLNKKTVSFIKQKYKFSSSKIKKIKLKIKNVYSPLMENI